MKRLVSRRLVIALSSLLLLAVVALVAVRIYLGTDSAQRLIVEQLSSQFGGKDEIDSLDVSTFGSSRVRGVRVADGDAAEPFLVIDTVDADLSALSILFGRRMPHRLDADGVRIFLRFDASGKLLTKLPESGGGGPLPSVRLRDGQLTLSQQGRPPLVIHRIDLAIAPDQPGIGGTGIDPRRRTGEIPQGQALKRTISSRVPGRGWLECPRCR